MRSPRAALACEFALLFVGLPLLAAAEGPVLRHWIIPLLIGLAALSLVALRRDPSFSRAALFLVPTDWRHHARQILVPFLAGGMALLAWAMQSDAVDAFGFPRQRPVPWAALLVVYPLVSASAQELVFRAFMFHRYRPLFAAPGAMIAASAGSFALAHLILGNWQAPTLTLVGGVMFATTYSRSRSLLLVTLEHGLWGDWLFTLGFGRYLYGGHA